MERSTEKKDRNVTLTMNEDSAFLVPPLASAKNRIPDECQKERTKEITNRAGDALVGFHEDALSQVTVGRAQLILTIVLALGIVADCGHVSILDYILLLAEVHLCLGENEKKWLVTSTFLALAGGSFAWGIVGDRLGRRKALISTLFVAVLFSGIATVMPTYGTFMTAWFCASLGVSGIFPLSFSYLAENCSRATRCFYIGSLYSLWPVGSLYIFILAYFILPVKGVDIVQDNQEHWSSWHKFLILSIIPTLLCLFGLIWTSESPRYLLEASREVEALAVYQRLHKLNKTSTQYGMTEMELPRRGSNKEERSTSPERSFLKHYIYSNAQGRFQEIIQRISTPTLFRATLILAVFHLIIGFVYVGISSFSVSLLKEYKNQKFFSERTYVEHEYFSDMVFNSSIENMEYKYTTFKNITFQNINFNHVLFTSCIFDDSEFINVKTSKTYFHHVTVQNCRFVDTELTDHHFLESTMKNNTFISLIFECPVDFDYNTFLPDIFYNYRISPSFVMLFIIGNVLDTHKRPKFVVGLTIVATFCSIGMFYMTAVWPVLNVEFVLKFLMICITNIITIIVIETYPCHLRCTAHGFMRCLYHLASLCGINVYGSLIGVILMVPTIITLTLLLILAFLSRKIQDYSKNYL